MNDFLADLGEGVFHLARRARELARDWGQRGEFLIAWTTGIMEGNLEDWSEKKAKEIGNKLNSMIFEVAMVGVGPGLPSILCAQNSCRAGMFLAMAVEKFSSKPEREPPLFLNMLSRAICYLDMSAECARLAEEELRQYKERPAPRAEGDRDGTRRAKNRRSKEVR